MVAFLVLPLALPAADTLDGTWTATFKTLSGPQKITWTLSTKGDKLTGIVVSAANHPMIEAGSVKGTHVTWLETDVVDGTKASMKYDGVWLGDTLELTRVPFSTYGVRSPDFGSGGIAVDDAATARRVK